MKIRVTEAELMPELLAFARERYGFESVGVAWDEFLLGGEEEDPSVFSGSFDYWFVFNWLPEGSPEAPVALTYLHERGERLSSYEKRFIEEACSQPFSFFSVLDTEPGMRMTLRDILLGREVTVKERMASTSLKRGDIIFARVVALEGQAILLGMMPMVIPPREQFDLLDFRDELAEEMESLPTRDDLLGFDPILREIYFDMIDEVMNPPPPILVNTDGDPLLNIEIRYRLKVEPEEAVKRLRTLVFSEARPHILEDAVYDSKGRLRSVEFDWHKRGNKINPAWTNTVLGHLALKGERLTITVNSEKRAKKIQAEIQKRLGDGAEVTKITRRTMEELQAQSRRRAGKRPQKEEAEALSEPEKEALIREAMVAHWKAWLDLPIPILRGQTPRQAARTPEGRERLEALFLEFESKSEQQKEALRPDVQGLRRELGLGGEKRSAL